MKILGINGGFRQGYQDVSACLVVDGKVIAAIEEERLNRIKFSSGRLPYLSVLEVLRMGNITIQDIDIIAFHGSTWNDEIKPRLEDYFTFQFGHCPKIIRYHHHDCHAASSYYASGFDESTVITIDNSGDGVSIQVMEGENGELRLIERIERPDSLGLFYQLITQYCGYTKDSDEYKLMGLSSYGKRDFFDFSWLISFVDGKIKFNTDYIKVPKQGESSLHKDEMVFNNAFLVKMGKKRRIPKSDIPQFYKDVAASAQQHLENLMLQLVQYYIKNTGKNKLCLAGGTALNCVMNQKLMEANFVENVFIQPASGDAGISLGAAWLACKDLGIKPLKPLDTYLGNCYTNEEIEEVLNISHIKYSKVKNVAIEAAKAIADNQITGWFQGRMEFGPRALGNRSVLANPTNPAMKDLLNNNIKFRESYRPFCPSVIEEDAHLYFKGKNLVSPHMTVTFEATSSAKEDIPSAIHVDNTARIQTVNSDQNEVFYNLLLELKKINGHGVVLNTSFNLSHEPIVCSPRDAISTFFASGMDVLFLGDYMIKKSIQ